VRALAPPAAVRTAAAVGAGLLLAPLLALALAGGVSNLGTAVGNDAVQQALWLTAWTSTIATILAVATGVSLAYVAERERGGWATVAGLVSEVPLVVPPVVVGLGLLLAFGRNGLLGGALDAAGLRLTFTSAAVVIAQASVATPLVVLAVRSGLASTDPTPELAADALGAGPWQRFRWATLPSLRGPILLGAALGWGRAAGEFGATLTFAGSLPGTTRTLPLEVFNELQDRPREAAAAALLQLLLAGLVLVVARRLRDTLR